MISFKLDKDTYDEILYNLNQLKSSKAKSLVRSAVAKVALMIKNEAKSLAPKGKTGNLRKGIKHQSRKGSRDEVIYSIGWAAPAQHGLLIEKGHEIYGRGPTGGPTARGAKKPVEGTRRTRPQEHLKPAFYNSQSQAMQIFENELSADVMAQKLFKSITRGSKK